jgi:hypothetical protein
MEISYIDYIIENITLQNNYLTNIINNGLLYRPCNSIINTVPETQRLMYFKRLISNLINNSIKCNRNITINITPVELNEVYIKQKGKCALSKKDLTFNYKNKSKKYNNSFNNVKKIKEINDFNISISRIDNNKGYTNDNIQLIACRINLMKNTLSNNEFIKLCGNIVKSHFFKFFNSIRSTIL